MGMLYTVESPTGHPTLAEAASKLNVQLSALDHAFGVVAIDPVRHLYAVQTRTDAANAPHPASAGVAGPFSNPRIEGFGPPKK
jgi:hypothetical protein